MVGIDIHIQRFSRRRSQALAACVTLAVALLAGIAPAVAQSAKSPAAAEIDRNVDAALKSLYAKTPAAKTLARKAKGVLVFPSIVKGGLIVGAQYGKGALRKGGKTVAYYETVSASYGLQAGVQKFGYALFFMNDAALGYLDRSAGWEIGVGPSVVVVDAGMAKALTTTTLKDDVYAFFFDQKGLMAGLGLQGSKITRFHP
ncbi:MAG: lipid-binding SYLF domain-containing protein [Burkholderiales bacterium]|nr:lipid-binding SYLF domain-containing protein [Burkholderiales bacterium]